MKKLLLLLSIILIITSCGKDSERDNQKKEAVKFAIEQRGWPKRCIITE